MNQPMSGGNKRLTVSYGTFSCTLEGFDDAFEAMKAIAEYFRDLSAQDRYFGATPPTPDVAMLQQIAETEMRRQIEAHVDGDGVVLKAAPAAPPDAAATAARAAPQAESVAARLARIRAMAAKGREGDTAAESIFAEDEGEVARAAEPPAPRQLPAADPTALRFEDMGLGGGVEPIERVVVEDAAAAPLRPVAGAPELAAASPPPSPPWPRPSPLPDPAPPSDPRTQRATPGPLAPPPRAAATVEDSGLANARDLLALHSGPGRTEAAQAAIMPDEVHEPAPSAVTPAPPASEIPVAEPAAPGATPYRSAEADPDLVAISRMLEAETGVRPAAQVTAGTVETVAEPPFDVATGGTGQTVDTGETEAMAAGQRSGMEEHLRSFLSKVRLIGRTRGPVSDRPDGNFDARGGDEGWPAEADGSGSGRGEGAGDGPDDADVARLVETANSRLEVAESQRRRSAISHLKAAVAATEADRQLGHGGDDEAGGAIDRYRDDLSRIVQMPQQRGEPRREDAPFVLGSDSRVDETSGGTDRGQSVRQPRSEEVDKFLGMILPRRFSAASIASLDNGDDEIGDHEDPPTRSPSLSFPKFAAVSGASDLLDLLEAAAAYLTIQEGREAFTRPQVMRKVAQLAMDEEISREDGLRSFGALLRDGRLQKARRGRFTISQSSRFMEIARRTTGGPIG